MLLFMTEIDSKSEQEFVLSIYDRYRRLMFSIAKEYLSDEQEREDLIQDCMVKLIGKVKTLQTLNDYALTAYVALTVKTTAINFLEKQGVRNRHLVWDDPDEEYVDAAPSPEELLLLSEQIENFRVDFARLTEGDRQLLAGKYILELSDAELGEMFHCKPDSIRMKLTRAKRRALALFMEGEHFSGKA